MDSDHCVAIWERTLLHIWRGTCTAPAVAEMARIARRLIASPGAPVTSFSLVEEQSGPPPEHARAELAKFTQDCVAQMAGAVIVAEGSGFRTSLVRGVGTALTLLVPHRVPYKFFSNVTEGAAFLAPYLPPGAGGSVGLKEAVESLRAQEFTAR